MKIDCGIDRVTDRVIDRVINRLIDRVIDRGIDCGLDRVIECGIDHVIDRGIDRDNPTAVKMFALIICGAPLTSRNLSYYVSTSLTTLTSSSSSR